MKRRGAHRAWALGVAMALVAAPAWADDDDEAEPQPKAPRRSFLVPALESEVVHLGFTAFSNLVSREAFARISFDSIKSHFDGRAPWTFDVDYFLTNQFGHPYQGALAFTAARSSGLNVNPRRVRGSRGRDRRPGDQVSPG